MTDKKTEALKLALAVLKEWRKGFPDDWTDFDAEAVASIREALAEQPAPQQDIPDLIAGALGVSRGTAYDLMREVRAEQPARREPLTDEQCKTLWAFEWKGERVQFIRAIEAAHGITGESE